MEEQEVRPGQPAQALLQENGDERMWGMFCHLSTFFGLVFPLGNIIGPLVVWLIKKSEYPLVDDQGKEALNFQISITIYFLVSALLILILIGIPLLIGLGLFDFIITIVATIKANGGIRFRYPLTIRFVH